MKLYQNNLCIKELINICSVYMGHKIYCTVQIGHVLGAVELAEFPLHIFKDMKITEV